MTKDERQHISVYKWRDAKGIGTIQGATGFGKTRCGTNILLKLQDRNITGSIIVVPTDALKKQWEQILGSLNIYNYKVYIINSLILEPNVLTTNILILDEIHCYAADTFYQVFEKINYKYILGLTATLERLDERHTLLEKHAPIIDTITLEEAKKNGWVSDFIEYNLYIEMDEEERKDYNSINNTISSLFATFNHDYNILRSCTTKKTYYDGNKMVRGADMFIRDNPQLSLYDAYNNKIEGESLLSEVSKQANICLKKMRDREDFLNKFPRKIDITAEIIKKFNKKTVTFGNNTSMADAINQKVKEFNIPTAAFHSNLESETIIENKVKIYKTLKAAETFSKKVKGKISQKDFNTFYVTYKKEKVLGIKTLKEKILNDLNNNNITCIHTAKALDLGLDVSGMEMAIIYAGKGNPTTQQQRIGRVIRKEGNKISIIVNLIVKGTQDERWAKRRQIKNERFIRHINNINEII